MAVKRRVIWLSDEDWSSLQERARQSSTTASALIREAIAPRHLVDVVADGAGNVDIYDHPDPEGKTKRPATELERSALVWGYGDSFGHPSPAPKPGKSR